MKKIITLFVIVLCIASCKKESTASTTSPFKGTWAGVYTGSTDNGSWSMSVDETGKSTGTVTSIVFAQTWNANGNVAANGQFSAVAGTATSGATFTGTLVNTNASGTWVNTASHNGTWIGTKQ